MAVRDIIILPDKRLRLVSEPIEAIDREVKALVADLFETMYDAPGIGLAAIQIGVPRRVVTMDLSKKEEEKQEARVFINPEILERKGAVEDEEGCLSFPDLYAKVRRARTVKVRAYNLKGELREITESDLNARLWQHEVDHLNGILFIDKMGPIAKLASRGALKEFEREFRRAQERGEIPPDAEIKQMLDALAAGA
jgi:peptide deformylase